MILNLYFLCKRCYFLNYYSYIIIIFNSFLFMDIHLEMNIMKKFLKNKFEFINIEQHSSLYNFEISYLDKNLLYVKIYSKDNKDNKDCKEDNKEINKNNGWKEDIKIKLYNIEENDFEELSIGSSNINIKEIEFYTDIDLYEKEELIRNNIPNQVFISKSFEVHNKNDFYDLRYFLYKNNFYSFINDFELINHFFNEQYNHLNEIMNFIINPNIILIIKLLFYLNKNGGIFINENLKNINIDTINKDSKICYINNNFISIIFCTIHFLNEELLIEDLKNKNKLDFRKYLNDFEIFIDEPIVTEKKLCLTNDYYNNIIEYDDYIFYILSQSEKYTIEKLPNNYYCLNNEASIDNNVEVTIFNKTIQSSFQLDDKYIKNKFNNNIIFKL